MQPDLSVLIPTRNRCSVLEVTLQAMSRLRLGRLTADFIVIDNGSVDATRAVAKQFEDVLAIKYLWAPTPGKSHALNRALGEATLGRIVVFTDDDVTAPEEWLHDIVGVCERWPGHSVFGGRIEPAWPDGCPVPAWMMQDFIQSFAFAKHAISDREGEYRAGKEPFGPNFWIRRAALADAKFFEGIGPHPSRRKLGGETFLLRQLRRKGMVPVYSPHVLVQHRIEKERLTRAAIYRRVLQLGRGDIYTNGIPELTALRRSKMRWRLRRARDIATGLIGLPLAVISRDEQERELMTLRRLRSIAANAEALRLTRADERFLVDVGVGGDERRP